MAKRITRFGLVFYGVAVAAAAWAVGGCALSPKGNMDRLVAEGSVKVGGGCVAYFQGEVKLRPRGETVEVVVDNNGGFFYVGGKRVPSFTRVMPAGDAARFLADVKRLATASRPEPWPSTGAATMVLYLPLEGGVVEGKFAEAHGKGDRDPLLERIKDFVGEAFRLGG